MPGSNDNSGVIALLGLAVLAGGAVLASKGRQADAGESQQMSGLGDLGAAPAPDLLQTLMQDIRTGYDKGKGGKAKPKVTALALQNVVVVPDEDVSVEPEAER